MYSFDFPWWFIALVYLIIFMAYFGIGALIGFTATCALLANSERRGLRRSRLRKVGISLLGALAGGAVNLLIALLTSVF